MSKLTELDLKYLSKLIGRDANEEELRLIDDTLRTKLNIRRYLEIVARLNKGAKRNPNGQNLISKNIFLDTFNSLKIYTNKKVSYQDNNSIDLVNTNQVHNSKILSYYGNEFDQSLIKKYDNNIKDYNLIQNRSNQHSVNDIIFKTDIELSRLIDNDTIDYSKYIVSKIDFGNDIKKNRKILNNMIEISKNENWFISAKIITENGINDILINVLNGLKSGIVVDNKISFESLFEKIQLSLLAIGNNSNKVNQYCLKNDLVLTKIGKLNVERTFQLEQKDILINLPMSAFELQYDVNTKHFEQPTISDFSSNEIIKRAKNNSYSDQLFKMFEKISTNNRITNNEDYVLKEYGFVENIKSINKKISVITSDYNNLLLTAPRSSAKIAVANATRKMSCMGLTPKFINIHNLFSEEDSSTNWFASEILQGQEEAIRELELTISNRKISQFDNNWQQNVSVIGFGSRNINTGISFKDDADFISLLGSHRGELVGTEYNRYINDKVNSNLPTVDLNMERRLQDVVQQGVSTNLLKSATNVSLGGISTAVAMSLAVSTAGIGAKIHLSRKLTNEELLFGETQGLVIVTLSEEDIMEFERICMTVGVPSTTIGRVTNTNQFTFNDLIKINADKLRKQ